MGKIINRRILMFLLLSVGTVLQVQAQYQDDEQQYQMPEIDKSKIKPAKANVIKIAPLALFIGQIGVAAEARFIYELVVAPQQSYYIGASINFQNFLTQAAWDSANTQYGTHLSAKIGFRVQGGYKYYVIKSQDAPNGLFVGPHASYNFLKVTDDDYPNETARVIFLNVNAVAGYQVVLGKGFVMEMVTGVGWRKNFVKYYKDKVKTSQETIVKGFKPTINFNIGVLF